jgi:phosphotransferase system  glucose/maltose/N-acetylglucosamine-specific IIC component
LAGTLPGNNSLLARTVPANNSLLAGTDQVNNSLLAQQNWASAISWAIISSLVAITLSFFFLFFPSLLFFPLSVFLTVLFVLVYTVGDIGWDIGDGTAALAPLF